VRAWSRTVMPRTCAADGTGSRKGVGAEVDARRGREEDEDEGEPFLVLVVKPIGMVAAIIAGTLGPAADDASSNDTAPRTRRTTRTTTTTTGRQTVQLVQPLVRAVQDSSHSE
jgi:hypothetical protein